MTKTYQQIKRQIEDLQKEAERLRKTEIEGVIDRIKVAINEYGLTSQQLGFGRSSTSAATPTRSGRPTKSHYSDGQGNAWGGRGPRPAWLKAALESGKSLEELRTGPGTAGSKRTKGASAKPDGNSKTKPRRRARLAYLDPQSRQSWSGMGPQPAWLKNLIASGKSLSDFAIRNKS